MIDCILATAASIVVAVVRSVPVRNDIVAVIGALIGGVIVVMEARKKDRTFANSVVLFTSSTFIGGVTPGVLFGNVWPDLADRFTWHVWISLGFLTSLVGWVLVKAGWDFVKRNRSGFVTAALSRLNLPPPKEPPDV